MLENASIESDDVYKMSGETGSLRYMAPEVLKNEYGPKCDVRLLCLLIVLEKIALSSRIASFASDLGLWSDRVPASGG